MYKQLKNKYLIALLICAIMLSATLLSANVYAAEIKSSSQAVPYSGNFIAGNYGEFYYITEISVTVPAGKTARSLKVIGTLDGNSNTGATGTIKSPQSFSTPKEFPLDGQYHEFSIWSATNKTITYTVTVSDASKLARVSIILCD